MTSTGQPLGKPARTKSLRRTSSGIFKQKSSQSVVSGKRQLRLVLVRHGETLANAGGKVQGQTDGKLSPIGCQQAKLVGRRLARQRWDAIYCSDLGRAKETAAEIYTAASDTSAPSALPRLVPLPILRERSAGNLEGAPSGSIERGAREANVPSRLFCPTGGESWEDVKLRAEKFLHWVVESHLEAPQRPLGGKEGGLCACGWSDGTQGVQGLGCSGGALVHRRKRSGRTAATRVLAVTHGGFIKEFVHASLAYKKPAKPAAKKPHRTSTVINRPPSTDSLANLQLQSPPTAATPWNPPPPAAMPSQPSHAGMSAEASSAEVIAAVVHPKGRETATERGPEVNDAWNAADFKSLQEGKRKEERGCSQMAHGVEVGRWAPEAAPQSYLLHPVRPRNTAIYEFAVSWSEGSCCVDHEGSAAVGGQPPFTVRMVKENDVSHLNCVISIPSSSPKQGHQQGEIGRVLWQSPLADTLAL